MLILNKSQFFSFIPFNLCQHFPPLLLTILGTLVGLKFSILVEQAIVSSKKRFNALMYLYYQFWYNLFIFNRKSFFYKIKCVNFVSSLIYFFKNNVHSGSGVEQILSKIVNPKNQEPASIYLQSTRNNTICTLVDCYGKAVCCSSAGSIGFKNTRKSTTYAAQAVAEKIAEKTLEKGFFSVRVLVKGLGYGKQSGVRALFKSGLKILSIQEITPISYNGSRPRKKRRV